MIGQTHQTLFQNFQDFVNKKPDILLCFVNDGSIDNSQLKGNSPPADLNLFLEITSQLLMRFARYNVLIPNQEWFYLNWSPLIPLLDEFLNITYGNFTIILDP